MKYCNSVRSILFKEQRHIQTSIFIILDASWLYNFYPPNNLSVFYHGLINLNVFDLFRCKNRNYCVRTCVRTLCINLSWISLHFQLLYFLADQSDLVQNANVRLKFKTIMENILHPSAVCTFLQNFLVRWDTVPARHEVTFWKNVVRKSWSSASIIRDSSSRKISSVKHGLW